MPDGNDYEFFGKSYFGVCNVDPSQTQAYSVGVNGFTTNSLVEGARVSILFRYAPKVRMENAKLNVSGTGAKPMTYFSEYLDISGIPANAWSDNQIVEFMYDGTRWLILQGSPRIWFGTCDTAADGVNKTCNITGFNSGSLVTGTIVVLNFSHGNSATSPNLSISGTSSIQIVGSRAANGGMSGMNPWGTVPRARILVYDSEGLGGGCWYAIDDPKIESVNGQTGAVSISVPNASTSAPLMDGTASYGSGTVYARSNHVHPTDTSRQETLVSGTNIKTVGGTSLLGSGDIALPTVPTNVSSFTNDAGYLTLSTLPIWDGSVT